MVLVFGILYTFWVLILLFFSSAGFQKCVILNLINTEYDKSVVYL